MNLWLVGVWFVGFGWFLQWLAGVWVGFGWYGLFRLWACFWFGFSDFGSGGEFLGFGLVVFVDGLVVGWCVLGCCECCVVFTVMLCCLFWMFLFAGLCEEVGLLQLALCCEFTVVWWS